ncbi:MAG: hypothetical protein M3229_04990, partial [Actinomycetota bacterium]|nr:hypothetical protein [Actinomycetota bacterium]
QPSDLRRRTLESPGMERLTEAAHRVLEDRGASPSDAAIAWRTVLAYVIGSIALDGATEPDDAAFEEGLGRVLRGTIGV